MAISEAREVSRARFVSLASRLTAVDREVHGDESQRRCDRPTTLRNHRAREENR